MQSLPARIAIALTALMLLMVGSLRVLTPPATTSVPAAPRGSLTIAGDATGTYRVGGYTIVLREDSLLVSHPRSPVEVWASPEGAFVVAAVGVSATQERSGVLRVADRWDEVFAEQAVAQAEIDEQGRLLLAGSLGQTAGSADRAALGYRVVIEADAEAGGLVIQAQVFDDHINRMTLVGLAEPGERVFGLGAQHAATREGGDLRGRAYPIVPREQGVGRGEQPLSLIVDLTSGGAGSADTTPAPLPVYITSAPRSLRLRGDDVGIVDLRGSRSIGVTSWARLVEAVVAVGTTPRAHVSAQARAAGTMRRVPRWLSDGAVVQAGGGRDSVRATIADLHTAGVDISSVWLADWAGLPTRRAAGAPSIFALEADRDRYGDLRGLADDLADDGIRLLLYAAPFLATVDTLYTDAEQLGHLLERTDGTTYVQEVDGEPGALVDLLDPEAREWFTDRIVVRVLGATGASGFMADLGHTLPEDAVTAMGTGTRLRGAYAEAWTQVTSDALLAAGLTADGLVWHAAAGSGSPPTMTMHAVADQLPDFSDADGLGSALDGMLAAGFSGLAASSFDIGGSTVLDLPGPLPTRRRTVEVAQRAAELAAFTTMMRTGDGPGAAIGVSTTQQDVTGHLAQMVSLYRALGPERARLGIDAEIRGVPYVRHPLLVVPEEPEVWDQDGIFFLGENLVVAPVLEAGVDEVAVALPPGSWVDVWSGEVTTVGATEVGAQRYPAPVGRPAAWTRQGTGVDVDLSLWRQRTR